MGEQEADGELAARFQREPELFTAVYDRYFRDVYRYAAGRVDVQAGEDIAAETFCVAFAERDRFDPERGSLRAWLFGIATNLVARMLAGLSRGERDVVLLVALSGLSHEEVAQALGISYGTVGSRLSRARRKLNDPSVQEAFSSTDELRILLSKPEPSEEVIDRRRHQLQNAMRVGPSRRRRGVLACALDLVAAAVGVAVVVASAGPAAVKKQSGRQILLAAAGVAERRPASSGAYWHVRIVLRLPNGTRRVDETWTGHNGTRWTPIGPASVVVLPGKGFTLGGELVGLQDIRRLPTDSTALAAWVDDAWRRTQQPLHLPARSRDAFTTSTLTDLLLNAPAPPRVRAAAFRVLATVPGVTSLGSVDGGQGLSMPGPNPGSRTRLVIDPGTSLIREYGFFGNPNATGTVEAAEWTNHLPKVVRKPLPG